MPKLPAFVGVDLGDQGYAVAKIIRWPGAIRWPPTRAQRRRQYAQAWAEAEAQAYYSALKTRFKVEINEPRRRRDAAAASAQREACLRGPRERHVDEQARRVRSAILARSAVAVAQLVESRIVIPVVVGSSPISHPILTPGETG